MVVLNGAFSFLCILSASLFLCNALADSLYFFLLVFCFLFNFYFVAVVRNTECSYTIRRNAMMALSWNDARVTFLFVHSSCIFPTNVIITINLYHGNENFIIKRFQQCKIKKKGRKICRGKIRFQQQRNGKMLRSTSYEFNIILIFVFWFVSLSLLYFLA